MSKKKKKSKILQLRSTFDADRSDPRRSVVLTFHDDEGQPVEVRFYLTLDGLMHAHREGMNATAALTRLTSRQVKLTRIFYTNFDDATRTAIFEAMREAPKEDAGSVVRKVLLERAGLSEDADETEQMFAESAAMEPVLSALAEASDAVTLQDHQALLLAGLYDDVPEITKADIEGLWPTFGALESAWREVEPVVMAYANRSTSSRARGNGQADAEEEMEALLLDGEPGGSSVDDEASEDANPS